MGILANSIILTFLILVLCEVQGRSFSQNQLNTTFKEPKVDARTASIPRVKINGGREIEPYIPPRRELSPHCSAVIQTGGKKYYGADGFLSVHKPRVNAGQWSSSRIKLSNGAESIETGWMVNPDVFKDDQAHLYARFVGANSGCINTDCPGFVHVGKKINLGRIPDRYGDPGGEQYSWSLSIDKHRDDGNWWLSISPSKYQIGYWPKSLFTGLADAATQIQWGGEIDNPGLSKPTPEMGTGREVEYDGKLSAFIGHLTIVDENYNAINPTDTLKFQDCQNTYGVLDFGFKDDEFGHFIVFGGPAPQ